MSNDNEKKDLFTLTSEYYADYQNYLQPRIEELYTTLIGIANKYSRIADKGNFNRHWKILYNELDYLLDKGFEYVKLEDEDNATKTE